MYRRSDLDIHRFPPLPTRMTCGLVPFPLKKFLEMYVPSPRTQLIDTPVVRGEGQGEGASPENSQAPHPDPLPTRPKEQIDDVWGEGTRSCDHRCKRETCSVEMALDGRALSPALNCVGQCVK